MEYLIGAFKIAILVTVGIGVIFNLPKIIAFVRDHKNSDKNSVVGQIAKWLGVFFAVLGIAFYGGAFLAYMQGIATQIGLLAICGTLCLVFGICGVVYGNKKIKLKSAKNQ